MNTCKKCVCVFKKGQIHMKNRLRTRESKGAATEPKIPGSLEHSGEGALQACFVLKLFSRLPHLAITGARTLVR